MRLLTLHCRSRTQCLFCERPTAVQLTPLAFQWSGTLPSTLERRAFIGQRPREVGKIQGQRFAETSAGSLQQRRLWLVLFAWCWPPHLRETEARHSVAMLRELDRAARSSAQKHAGQLEVQKVS